MNKTIFTVGNILKDCETGEKYRVLNITLQSTTICKMDTTITYVTDISTSYLISLLSDKKYTIEEEPSLYVDLNSLTDKTKEKHKKYMTVLNDFTNRYGPDYTILNSKKKNQDIYKEFESYKISRSTFWKIVQLYLQSGFNQYSIIDKRFISHKNNSENQYKHKPGRKNKYGVEGKILTNEDIEHFDEAIKNYLDSRQSSLKKVFDKMNDDYYRDLDASDGKTLNYNLKPISERPTYNQLYYYLNKKVTHEEKLIKKSSSREVRNTKRLLNSDSVEGIQGPGYLVEMDTVETNVYLVNEVANDKPIGRAYVYAMKDVYSKVILAISVGFENNSIQGFVNTMINLGEDKVDYCKRFGITITKEQWPSNIIPKNMRFDRGADYKSHKVKQILNELNISRNLVPGASGSLKGDIEQWFHQLDRSYAGELENNGYMEKRYDSNHAAEAVLTVKDFTKIIINFVIAYNQSLLSKYSPTSDMTQHKIPAIPIKLWQYGCEKYGNPSPISKNIALQYTYNLMSDVKNAKLGRGGIIIDGLHYANPEDHELEQERFKLGNKKAKFHCRWDPQNISRIYYIRDNVIMTASLSQKNRSNEWNGMSHKEYLSILEISKEIEWQNKANNQTVAAKLHHDNAEIIKEAKARKKGKRNASKKTDVEARNQSKTLLAKENDIFSRLVGLDEGNQEEELNVLDQSIDEEITTITQTKQTYSPQEALAKYRSSSEW